MIETPEEWRNVLGSNQPWKVSNHGRLLLGFALLTPRRRQVCIAGRGNVSPGILVLVGPCPEGMA